MSGQQCCPRGATYIISFLSISRITPLARSPLIQSQPPKWSCNSKSSRSVGARRLSLGRPWWLAVHGRWLCGSGWLCGRWRQLTTLFCSPAPASYCTRPPVTTPTPLIQKRSARLWPVPTGKRPFWWVCCEGCSSASCSVVGGGVVAWVLDVEVDCWSSFSWYVFVCVCTAGAIRCGPEELSQQLHQGEYSTRVQCTGGSLSGLWGAQVRQVVVCSLSQVVCCGGKGKGKQPFLLVLQTCPDPSCTIVYECSIGVFLLNVFSQALKMYMRARDHCTSSSHIVQLCLNIIKVRNSLARSTRVSFRSDNFQCLFGS